MFDPREKIALFIDGANLYAASKSLNFDIDYRKLLKAFQSRGYLLRAYYYTALIEDQEYSSIRPLIDWLDYNGYKVVTKPAKEFNDSMGRRRWRFHVTGRSAAAQGPQGDRGLLALLATADDRRRSAPSGRLFHRVDQPEIRNWP